MLSGPPEACFSQSPEGMREPPPTHPYRETSGNQSLDHRQSDLVDPRDLLPEAPPFQRTIETGVCVRLNGEFHISIVMDLNEVFNSLHLPPFHGLRTTSVAACPLLVWGDNSEDEMGWYFICHIQSLTSQSKMVFVEIREIPIRLSEVAQTTQACRDAISCTCLCCMTGLNLTKAD